MLFAAGVPISLSVVIAISDEVRGSAPRAHESIGGGTGSVYDQYMGTWSINIWPLPDCMSQVTV